jgi:hypothetical protein
MMKGEETMHDDKFEIPDEWMDQCTAAMDSLTCDRVADHQVLMSIALLVNCLLFDHEEFEHYLGSGASDADHIWHDIKIVRDWLGYPRMVGEDERIVAARRRAAARSIG